MNKKLMGIIITGSIMLQVGYAQAGLIISEYVEGSSNNKALELFNTGEAIDFSSGDYILEVYSNANTSPSRTIELTGSINAGETFVITHAGASTELMLFSDLSTTLLNFNGNDSLVLRQAGNILDSFGQVGTDLSQGWGVDKYSTFNNTLRRQEDVMTGDVSVLDMFDPAQQWTGLRKDDFSGLGQHAVFAMDWQSAGGQSDSVSVPEPGTMLLLLVGFVGLMVSGNRKAVSGLGSHSVLLAG